MDIQGKKQGLFDDSLQGQEFDFVILLGAFFQLIISVILWSFIQYLGKVNPDLGCLFQCASPLSCMIYF